MNQRNARRIQDVYSRAQKAARPCGCTSWILGAALVFSLATLIGTLAGWFEGIVPIDLLAMFIVLPIVLVFVISVFAAIIFSADVLLLKQAIRKLRFGDWDFLCHVVLGRPVRSKEVLSDPGIVFTIGHLFRKLGYHRESQDLISQAVSQSPDLAQITFSTGDVLSVTDEAVLTKGLERVSKARLFLRVWSNPRTRHTVFVVGAILLLVFYVLQFIKIVWWQN